MNEYILHGFSILLKLGDFWEGFLAGVLLPWMLACAVLCVLAELDSRLVSRKKLAVRASLWRTAVMLLMFFPCFLIFVPWSWTIFIPGWNYFRFDLYLTAKELVPGLLFSFFVIYLTGFVLVLIKLIRNQYQLKRFLLSTEKCAIDRINHSVRTLALRHHLFVPEVRICNQSISPAVVGSINTILLPRFMAETWSDEELRPVLAHELAHLAFNDHTYESAMKLLKCILWFFPPLYWMHYRLEETREEQCDSQGVLASPSLHDYTELLLRLAEQITASPVNLMSASFITPGNKMVKRFERLMNQPTQRELITNVMRQFMVVVTWSIVLILATCVKMDTKAIMVTAGSHDGIEKIQESDPKAMERLTRYQTWLERMEKGSRIEATSHRTSYYPNGWRIENCKPVGTLQYDVHSKITEIKNGDRYTFNSTERFVIHPEQSLEQLTDQDYQMFQYSHVRDGEWLYTLENWNAPELAPFVVKRPQTHRDKHLPEISLYKMICYLDWVRIGRIIEEVSKQYRTATIDTEDSKMIITIQPSSTTTSLWSLGDTVVMHFVERVDFPTEIYVHENESLIYTQSIELDSNNSPKAVTLKSFTAIEDKDEPFCIEENQVEISLFEIDANVPDEDFALPLAEEVYEYSDYAEYKNHLDVLLNADCYEIEFSLQDGVELTGFEQKRIKGEILKDRRMTISPSVTMDDEEMGGLLGKTKVEKVRFYDMHAFPTDIQIISSGDLIQGTYIENSFIFEHDYNPMDDKKPNYRISRARVPFELVAGTSKFRILRDWEIIQEWTNISKEKYLELFEAGGFGSDKTLGLLFPAHFEKKLVFNGSFHSGRKGEKFSTTKVIFNFGEQDVKFELKEIDPGLTISFREDRVIPLGQYAKFELSAVVDEIPRQYDAVFSLEGAEQDEMIVRLSLMREGAGFFSTN